MKKSILILFAFVAILTTSVKAQTDGLVDVYVTGPECCPDAGHIYGYRSNGGAPAIDYHGQTGTAGAPAYYVLGFTGSFNVVLPTTVEVLTDWDGNMRCKGTQTKDIGYGNGEPLVFNIVLKDYYYLNIPAPKE
jgi:hypothetical protein